MTDRELMQQALEAAYLAGFNDSAEGYNGEYPFRDYGGTPIKDRLWVARRDEYIRKALAEQPAQQRPQNCGTGFCSCIECPYEQPAQQEHVVLTDIEIQNCFQQRSKDKTNEKRLIAEQIVKTVLEKLQ